MPIMRLKILALCISLVFQHIVVKLCIYLHMTGITINFSKYPRSSYPTYSGPKSKTLTISLARHPTHVFVCCTSLFYVAVSNYCIHGCTKYTI